MIMRGKELGLFADFKLRGF